MLVIASGACHQKTRCPVTGIHTTFIDSIKQHSDSSYTKKYRPNEFAMVEYYINNKDSTLAQVMKDSAGMIRQVIVTNKNIRTYYAEFYSNGQLKGSLPLDSLGKYHGPGIYYFENGCSKSAGKFSHGLFSDQWKNYNTRGKLVSIEEYDNRGQLIKTERAN